MMTRFEVAENLPRLVLVSDEIWSEFESVLAKYGITMVSTDGVRSYRTKKTVHEWLDHKWACRCGWKPESGRGANDSFEVQVSEHMERATQ